MEEKISVILVNYNGAAYNDACVSSILDSDVGEKIQIVVVDNASTDGSREALYDRWGSEARIHVIALDRNYGFAKANNVGIRWSMEQGIHAYLLLNNDTEVAPDAIGRMQAYHRKTGRIVTPKVLYADRRDTVWCAGGVFTPVIKKSVQRGLDRKDEGQFDADGQCQFANGCAMFLSKEIVDRMGYMDERFFLYYEDTEYSMRAADRGIGVGYCAQALVYHKVNGSTGGNEKPANAYYITRNWLLCNSLHMRGSVGERLRFALFLVYFVCNRAAWLLIWFAQGRRAMCTALLRGAGDFCRKKWGKYDP